MEPWGSQAWEIRELEGTLEHSWLMTWERVWGVPGSSMLSRLSLTSRLGLMVSILPRSTEGILTLRQQLSKINYSWDLYSDLSSSSWSNTQYTMSLRSLSVQSIRYLGTGGIFLLRLLSFFSVPSKSHSASLLLDSGFFSILVSHKTCFPGLTDISHMQLDQCKVQCNHHLTRLRYYLTCCPKITFIVGILCNLFYQNREMYLNISLSYG